MDDIAIGTLLKELDLHIEMISDLFYILAAHGLHLKLSKSVFMQPQMDFLGVCISKDGVTVDPAKVAGLREYPRTLYNLKQARGFLRCTGYDRMFCKDYSIIAEPIFCLTKKDMPFEWGPEQQAAQGEIIKRITNSPVLARPDPTKQFELETDTSLIGTGAVLYQCNPPNLVLPQLDFCEF